MLTMVSFAEACFAEVGLCDSLADALFRCLAVLSGRGGGINSHAGNIQFREWVRVRKNDYNLAVNKNDKAQVAREVIALVQKQDPPGRFLQKDPSSHGPNGWWIEVDDERMMAKTAQALREGAPQIRAAHKDEIEENRLKAVRRSIKEKQAAMAPPAPMPMPSFQSPQARAMEELRANVEAAKKAQENERPGKRVRLDYNGHTLTPTENTPPHKPLPPPPRLDLSVINNFPPPPSRPVASSGNGLKRTHSLALSDFSLGEWANEDFVNPFENESDLDMNLWRQESNSSNNKDPQPQPGVSNNFSRETSHSSHGDMGGLSALFQSNRSSSSGSSSGFRKNSLGNLSSRYESNGADPLMDGSSTPLHWFDLESPPTPVSP